VPTYVAIANLTVNATLDWVFSRSLGIWSIPLATSIANIFGVCLLYVELRPVAGRLDERALLRAFVRIAAATVVAVAVGYGVWRALDTLLGQFLPFQLITLGAGLAATVGVYGLAARAMGIEELHIVLALLRSRRRPLPDSSVA
jgi:peptidoglycan biosynthesis protein MviN/MurJ (putative lipid II flippase)